MDFSGNAPRYCWYTTDHLGSVRAVTDASGNVFATYAYSPYGEDFAAEQLNDKPLLDRIDLGSMLGGVATIQPNDRPQRRVVNKGAMGSPEVTYSAAEESDWQPFKFSGKESLTRVGLDLYDFGARMYSPSNMRWMTMDPLAEKYYHISPYAYCAGNPVNLVDPDGMQWYLCTHEDDHTEYVYSEGAMSEEDRKSYKDVQYVGYTKIDEKNNKYYSLFGQTLDWTNSDGTPNAEARIYEVIDRLIKQRALKFKDPENDMAIRVYTYIAGVREGKHYITYKKDNTFSTIATNLAKGGTDLEDGSFFTNNKDQRAVLDVMPGLPTSVNNSIGGPIWAHWLLAHNPDRNNWKVLQLKFDKENARKFITSWNNIFHNEIYLGDPDKH